MAGYWIRVLGHLKGAILRFTLERDGWYAMELIGPEFGKHVRDYSPIQVYGLQPQGGGSRCFELDFFHANYPAGVQSKKYTIETIDRRRDYLLGRVVGTDRIALFLALSEKWLKNNFNAKFDRDQSPEDWVIRAVKK